MGGDATRRGRGPDRHPPEVRSCTFREPALKFSAALPRRDSMGTHLKRSIRAFAVLALLALPAVAFADVTPAPSPAPVRAACLDAHPDSDPHVDPHVDAASDDDDSDVDRSHGRRARSEEEGSPGRRQGEGRCRAQGADRRGQGEGRGRASGEARGGAQEGRPGGGPEEGRRRARAPRLAAAARGGHGRGHLREGAAARRRVPLRRERGRARSAPPPRSTRLRWTRRTRRWAPRPSRPPRPTHRRSRCSRSSSPPSPSRAPPPTQFDRAHGAWCADDPQPALEAGYSMNARRVLRGLRTKIAASPCSWSPSSRSASRRQPPPRPRRR